MFKDKVLIFDLDATLYYVGEEIEDKCTVKLINYISNKLQISYEESKNLIFKVRKKYQYQTDAIGKEFPFTINELLEEECDVDVSMLKPNEKLNKILYNLPNDKYILTNSTHKHVNDTLKQIAIDKEVFNGIFDIQDMNYKFKHNIEGYKIFLDYFSLKAKNCCMFDDSVYNLESAKLLGITTILVNPTIKEKPLVVDYLFPDITTALEYLLPNISLQNRKYKKV